MASLVHHSPLLALHHSMSPGHIAPSHNIPNPRNAGRKKSNPVWEFFTDLRAYGLAGVRCRFCHWITNDRSPTTMKFHLKRKHDTGAGGLWALCDEKIGQQAPASYSRKRPSTEGGDMLRRSLMHNGQSINGGMEQMLTSLLQQAASIPTEKDLPPHVNNNGIENGSGAHAYLLTNGEDSDPLSLDDSLSNHSGPTSFSLSDGVAELVQIANESDLVFTFNSRRNGEFCFESNEPKKKGHLVTFADGVSELLVTYSIEGEEHKKECWKKSDWSQFQWAVRGTITHYLKE